MFKREWSCLVKKKRGERKSIFSLCLFYNGLIHFFCLFLRKSKLLSRSVSFGSSIIFMRWCRCGEMKMTHVMAMAMKGDKDDCMDEFVCFGESLIDLLWFRTRQEEENKNKSYTFLKWLLRNCKTFFSFLMKCCYVCNHIIICFVAIPQNTSWWNYNSRNARCWKHEIFPIIKINPTQSNLFWGRIETPFVSLHSLSFPPVWFALPWTFKMRKKFHQLFLLQLDFLLIRIMIYTYI